MDLESDIPCISFISKITVSNPLLVISRIAKFCVNYNFNIIVFCVFLSSTLIMADPEISFTNGASIFTNFCSFGFNIICSLGKNGMDMFKKLKLDSRDFIIPSNSNIYFYAKY